MGALDAREFTVSLARNLILQVMHTCSRSPCNTESSHMDHLSQRNKGGGRASSPEKLCDVISSFDYILPLLLMIIVVSPFLLFCALPARLT